MKKLIIITAAVFLSSCAINQYLYTNENDKPVYEVKSINSMGDCYKKAIQICPQGFEVLNKNVVFDDFNRYHLLYSCK